MTGADMITIHLDARCYATPEARRHIKPGTLLVGRPVTEATGDALHAYRLGDATILAAPGQSIPVGEKVRPIVDGAEPLTVTEAPRLLAAIQGTYESLSLPGPVVGDSRAIERKTEAALSRFRERGASDEDVRAAVLEQYGEALADLQRAVAAYAQASPSGLGIHGDDQDSVYLEFAVGRSTVAAARLAAGTLDGSIRELLNGLYSVAALTAWLLAYTPTRAATLRA